MNEGCGEPISSLAQWFISAKRACLAHRRRPSYVLANRSDADADLRSKKVNLIECHRMIYIELFHAPQILAYNPVLFPGRRVLLLVPQPLKLRCEMMCPDTPENQKAKRARSR
jgi:hypothetical protein